MANLTPIPTLLSMLKSHAGHNISVGVANDNTFYRLLSDMQRWLASEYDWPFLNTRFDLGATPATRYFTIPVALDTQRPFKVELKYNQQWQCIDYGIGAAEYNDIDSDQGQTNDPIQRWQWGAAASVNEEVAQGQFEVWPMCASAGQTLRFTGQRIPTSFYNLDGTINLTAKCDLDDELIVLFSAAELLFRYEQGDAQIKLAKAQQRLNRLRAIYPNRARLIILGSSQRDLALINVGGLVLVAGTGVGPVPPANVVTNDGQVVTNDGQTVTD